MMRDGTLRSTVRRWLGREDGERALHRRAEAVLAQPWPPFLWNNEPLRDVMPWYFARGEGQRVWAEDGREFVDLELGVGPTLLGHGHPVVREALLEHAGAPIVTSLLHRHEVEVAELLTSLFPGAERVVFGKNGSDACTAAARVARAATGRTFMLCHGYHGWHDWFAADMGELPGIVPAFSGHTMQFPFNDVRALEALADDHSHELAAIMMEPAYRHLPEPGYLQAVRRIADAHGALLIFDEMITAFRMHRGGAQAVYGVTPDLTCVGKSLANGMPLSALMGRKDVMEYVNNIFYGMTFQHDSVALAVSRACLRYYRDHDVAGDVNRKGERLRRIFDGASAAAGLTGRAVGLAARMDIDFTPVGHLGLHEQRQIFARETIRHGVLPVRVAFPCEMMTDADLEQVERVFAHGCQTVARALPRA
jgi:glutamate-1-semialdehyde 2,1-aminomutase